MRKKTNISLYLLLFFGILISCEKNDDNDGTVLFNNNIIYGTMTDQEGNKYKTVTIGTQTWMAENLRTTTYNDGTPITKVTGNNEWVALTTGAYCNYNSIVGVAKIANYGLLYNWHAINTGKLSPAGWHVPNDDDWSTLINYLGGKIVAGGKLKETGTNHWRHTNIEATNESGFTTLPGGARSNDGSFDGLGYAGYWWSASNAGVYMTNLQFLLNNEGVLHNAGAEKIFGLSVRCIKD